MKHIDCPRLVDFVTRFDDHAEVAPISGIVHDDFAGVTTVDDLIQLYRDAIPFMENHLWQQGVPRSDDLQLYQALCREMEGHYRYAVDRRHTIVIVIPVADRPRHLAECIDSIHGLCWRFYYGGRQDGRFQRVSILVADDSEQQANIEQHRAIADRYRGLGLDVEYFGLAEQIALIEQLSHEQQENLRRITGTIDRSTFYHKGASITRNITCIRLAQLAERMVRPLFYFIDSDQEFRLSADGSGGENAVFGLNYFYHLDRIFSSTRTRVLTGKVVGDPPVSPAVMAGNMLDDVIAFLQQLADRAADGACEFHDRHRRHDDASYHDMAELFGFGTTDAPYRYACRIPGDHDHRQCYRRFALELNRFFDGEHPTRKTGFDYQPVQASVKPARTVYTGNYVISPEALDFFIPFAPLRLRMAGPVLGRLMQGMLGDQFVSAGLPMLHRRTVEGLGQSEFRAGIEHLDQRVDLGDEFERQYYGDVMLFSMETLVQQGYPDDHDESQVRQVLEQTEQQMREKYRAIHEGIRDKNRRLRALFHDDGAWWNQVPELDDANRQLVRFMNNIDHNFSDHARAWQRINSNADRTERLQQLLDAVLAYPGDRAAWQILLDEVGTL